MKKTVLLFVILLLVFQVFSQHEHADDEGSQVAPFHKITLVTANSLINNIIDENSNSLLLVPVFGFNYDYFFHNSWGIGLHNDLVLQQYKVEKHHDSEELVRENPLQYAESSHTNHITDGHCWADMGSNWKRMKISVFLGSD